MKDIARRVGIYAGTFDPIHAGHLTFARHAIETCQLDKIFFLVEPRPRRKQGVRALQHREEMVRLAIKDQADYGMIVLEQANFSVEETLPKLKALFKGAELHMLLGEDVFQHLNSWPHVEELLNSTNFIVGLRSGDEEVMRQHLHSIEKARGIRFNTTFLVTEYLEISSSKIRLALKHNQKPTGHLSVLKNYIQENKLYTTYPK
ncbi:nicotinate-nicotinamide nucleotide adenylyltransferase [Candidatus Saccharibacteria bacterium]|nr:nicotinate-nicotinamide nucleotide adenylyltransferase [Candidatus Saccharibacteria bacterium]